MYRIFGVLSIGIAVFIGWNATRNMIETIPVFLQAAPKDIRLGELRLKLLAVKGVVDIHSLHIWSLDEDENIGSVILIIEADEDAQQALKSATAVFKLYAIQRPVVQVEYADL